MTPIKLFEQKKVRSHYDADNEIWYFSVIDVIQILTGSTIPKRYWTDLKKKLKLEGSESYYKIVQFAYSSQFLLKIYMNTNFIK
jgi:DNA-damage-inducible protein D